LATVLPGHDGLPSPRGLSARGRDRGIPKALDCGADSDEQWCSEVGPWVGEMAGEVGDPIWSPVKEEAHQRVVSTRARLGRRGTVVRGGVRWWRSATDGSRRWSGHGRWLGGGRRRQGKASVAEEWEQVRWREESEGEGTPPLQPRAKG
jgi:hypothetical protein